MVYRKTGRSKKCAKLICADTKISGFTEPIIFGWEAFYTGSVYKTGTIIVQPEAVDEDKDKEFKGPEWKNTKRSTRAGKASSISLNS